MILDIILIMLIIFSAYKGYKKGLIGILISILAFVLAIVLGFILKEPVSNFLYENTNVSISIEESINAIINDNIIEKNEEVIFLENIFENQNILNSYTTKELSKSITMFILKIISFVLIMAAVYILCNILQMILNIFFKLPVIGSINKIGGLSINALQILVKIWLVLAIIYFIIPIQKNKSLLDVINNSYIIKTMYENNCIVSLIETNIKL